VVAFAKGITAPVPGVLVLHGVEGPSEAQVEFAKTLADWGYIGFAADLFSSSMRDSSLDERQQLMTSFMQKRPMLQSRLLHILDVLKGVNEGDGTRVAAVGFCFGGLCALDLARVGAELCGIASFHGVLKPPGNTQETKSNPRSLCSTGGKTHLRLPTIWSPWPRISARRALSSLKTFLPEVFS
jgi:dienelactone hydrolase